MNRLSLSFLNFLKGCYLLSPPPLPVLSGSLPLLLSSLGPTSVDSSFAGLAPPLPLIRPSSLALSPPLVLSGSQAPTSSLVLPSHPGSVPLLVSHCLLLLRQLFLAFWLYWHNHSLLASQFSRSHLKGNFKVLTLWLHVSSLSPFSSSLRPISSTVACHSSGVLCPSDSATDFQAYSCAWTL